MAHSTAVFSGRYVQTQMQAVFNGPIAAVGDKHLFGREGCFGPGADQPFYLNLIFLLFGTILFLLAINEPSEAGSLLDAGERDLFGGGIKANQATGFGSAPVDFEALDEVFCMVSKKKCPANARRGLERCGLLLAGFL